MRRLFAVLLVVLVAAACSKSSNAYGTGTEKAFLETCTINQQQPAAICGCMYEKITQQIPFDRYVELDKQMQSDERFVPDELVSIAADCASQLTTTTTESTTTTTENTTTTTESTTTTATTLPGSSGPSVSSPIGF